MYATGLRTFEYAGVSDLEGTANNAVSTGPVNVEEGVGNNAYAYVLNDPVNLIDPSGLQSIGGRLEQIRDAAIRLLIAAAAARCRAWAARQGNLNWLKNLPDCPCYLCELDKNQWTESEDANQTFHPGADKCIRSQPTALPGPGQQCCYNDKGELITSGAGAGTPDRIGPGPGNLFAGAHFTEDVSVYNSCRTAGLLGLYLQHRPPNKGNNCSF